MSRRTRKTGPAAQATLPADMATEIAVAPDDPATMNDAVREAAVGCIDDVVERLATLCETLDDFGRYKERGQVASVVSRLEAVREAVGQ